jgi:hypothetical protein
MMNLEEFARKLSWHCAVIFLEELRKTNENRNIFDVLIYF